MRNLEKALKKHKCILSLLLCPGIRQNELINLRQEHVDIEEKTIKIFTGKGNKEKISILSDISVKHLRAYLLEYKPKPW